MNLAKLTIRRRKDDYNNNDDDDDDADERAHRSHLNQGELVKYKLEETTTTSSRAKSSSPQRQRVESEPEEEPSNILNYLIGRLSEQHKTKLEQVAVTSKPREPPKSIDRDSLNTINSEFEQFERHLFEKYGLPMVDYSHEQKRAAREAEQTVEKVTETSSPQTPLVDSSYILTRSLYAEHKTINLDEPIVVASSSSSTFVPSGNTRRSASLEPHSATTNTNKQQQQQPVMRNKIITALSINEIETRKSITFDETNGNPSHKSYFLLLSQKRNSRKKLKQLNKE